MNYVARVVSGLRLARSPQRVWALALAASLTMAGLTADAQDAESPAMVAMLATSDPMELSRLVDRLGDAEILEGFAQERSLAARWGAARAAARMQVPALALGPLAAMASGRDPDLAPAAAASARSICASLDPQALDAAEVGPADLTEARQSFEALANDASARPDLRRVAAICGAAIDALWDGSRPGGPE